MDIPEDEEAESLTVRGLPFAGAMTVTHYAIDSGHSDVFAAWHKLGAPARDAITPEQVRQIKAHDALGMAAPPTTVAKVAKGGEWSVKLDMEPHGVSLFVLAAD